MKKCNAQAITAYVTLGVTIILLAATIFLLVQTIILTKWTIRQTFVSDQAASDIETSRESLCNVDTGISNLVTGLTGDDSQLIKQLGGIKSDTEATKDALVEDIKGDIHEIKKDVGTIKEQVEDIEDLLPPPSD